MLIYVLIDPRDERIRYVGKTVRSAEHRLRRHGWPSNLRGNTHKERWIRQLLALGLAPRIAILERCASKEQLNAAERAHIHKLRAANADLTNISSGGDGGCAKHTAESRARISLALMGKKKTPEHRRRAGEASRGRRASETTRAKMRASSPKRRPSHTAQHCINMSRGRGGRPFVDQNGVRYETQKGAARDLGLNVAHVNEVLHGHRPHTRGYRFRFVALHLRSREFPTVHP